MRSFNNLRLTSRSPLHQNILSFNLLLICYFRLELDGSWTCEEEINRRSEEFCLLNSILSHQQQFSSITD